MAVITARYEPPQPRSLPELRGRVITWLAENGTGYYLANHLVGRQWLPVRSASLRQGAAQMAADEQGRASGELYWISAEMTDLARQAGAKLPTRSLYAHDLPSERGFMFFEAPLGTYHNDSGRLVEIVAASWGPWDGEGDWAEEGGVWLTFYSHPAPFLSEALLDPRNATDEIRAHMRIFAPVMPDNEGAWRFGENLSDEPFPGAGTTGEWMATVRAAWRLMQQPLAEIAEETAIRAARRRLARAGLPEAGVRVVRIRRPKRKVSSTPSQGGREYSCRWPVTGHWRTYWCGPGRTRPEEVWIDEYVAGPEDKPIRGAERVLVWDR